MSRPVLCTLASAPETIDAGASLAQAAQRMARAHVGSLVVLEDGAPVGLVTDRDVTMAACTCPAGTAPPVIGAVASRPLVTLDEHAPLEALTRLMADRCIRRVGLVDGTGALTGIVVADAVVMHLGRRMGDLALTLEREFAEEREPTSRVARTFGPE